MNSNTTPARVVAVNGTTVLKSTVTTPDVRCCVPV